MSTTEISTGDATPTAADTSTILRRPPQVRTYASIRREVGILRDEVELTRDDVTDLHERVGLGELDHLTALVGRDDASQLLERLGSDWGLSWTATARLIGVSDTAVRKWRRGEAIIAENRRRLARLSAFLQMLRENFSVSDPASWMEMRISEEATVTPIDLYVSNRLPLLFDHAGRRLTPHAVLDAFDNDWRSRYAVDDRFEVVIAPDGEPAIHMRPPD